MSWYDDRSSTKQKVKKIDDYDRALMSFRNEMSKYGCGGYGNIQHEMELDIRERGEEAGIPSDIILNDIRSARQGGKYKNPYMGVDIVRIRKKQNKKPKSKLTKKCKCKK